MKKLLFLSFFLVIFTGAFCQSDFIVQHNEKEMYLNHKVAPRESFFSLGRMYNIAPKDIAEYNKLDMNKGLNIGQVIRIPLTAANFSQKSDKGKEVFYIVGEKEGLYRVSVKNNGVLMADLRKWNHLATDNISVGKKLIVGFIVNGEASTAVAATNIDKPEEKPAEVKKDVAENPKVKSEVEKKPETTVEKKTSAPVQQVAVNDGNGGYFKPLFDKQVKSNPVSANETVSAGIFKTSSGWQDSKYYVLIDKVEPGTIVRIVNPSNNKAVYAKVLGEMSGIRQNQGYDLRMSNAAASVLEVSDQEKFIVKINY
jgi:LysM repeat protein